MANRRKQRQRRRKRGRCSGPGLSTEAGDGLGPEKEAEISTDVLGVGGHALLSDPGHLRADCRLAAAYANKVGDDQLAKIVNMLAKLAANADNERVAIAASKALLSIEKQALDQAKFNLKVMRETVPGQAGRSQPANVVKHEHSSSSRYRCIGKACIPMPNIWKLALVPPRG